MEIDWNMAAVIVAITAIFFGPVYNFFVRVIWAKLQDYRRRNRKCTSLKWTDVPDGVIHDCAANMYCLHSALHDRRTQCWESDTSLGGIFNKAWRQAIQNDQTSQGIPPGLPQNGKFIQTDARTILAFFIYTMVPSNRYSQNRYSWDNQNFRHDSAEIQIDIRREVVIAHVQGSQTRQASVMKKQDILGLLEGYPPWYRKDFRTRANIEVPFPITGILDVPRGGWIVAVGLMDLSRTGQHPLPVYRVTENLRHPRFKGNNVYYYAIERCRDRIRDDILPHFPGSHAQFAEESLSYLIMRSTGSAMPHAGWFERKPEQHLTRSDCCFAMKLFSELQPLSNGVIDRLRPILFPVLAAAVNGAFEVTEYLKDHGKELQIPGELQPDGKVVYIRDCTTRLPIR
jgi:hypothetical protein